MAVKLFHHQQKLVDENRERLLIAWQCGVGKTPVALALIKKNKVPTLIITPKSLKVTWEKYLLEWGLDNITQVITKETFRRDWKKLGGYRAVIIDEVHYFAGLKSQLSKSLAHYLDKHQVKYRWFLSATPIRSQPLDIYVLAKHLGYDWQYWSFMNKFYSMVRMGMRQVPVVKSGIQTDLALLVHAIGDVVKLEDVVDLPDQIFETEWFELNKDQKEAIKDIYDPNQIVLYTKEHQIANGVLYGGEYDDFKLKTFSCQKTERIKELVEENDRIAIFARYNGQLIALKEALKDSNKPIFIINGKTKDRHTVVEEIRGLDKCIVLIQGDTAEGFELPTIRLFVFASLSWSYVNFIQACGRNSRINNLQRNVYITLVVKESIDEDVYHAIKRKEDFHVALYRNYN